MIGNKPEGEKTLVEGGFAHPKSVNPNAVAGAHNPRANMTKPTAIIGPKIRFKGELVGEEDLLVQGEIDGTIELRGHNLIVGKQGVLRANVAAKTITIEGTVEGDIFGQERIAILSSSNVKGNLVADRVTLEDGAKFRGSIDMDLDEKQIAQKIESRLKRETRREQSSSASASAPSIPHSNSSHSNPSQS